MADRIILIVPDGADNIIQLLCIHMQVRTSIDYAITTYMMRQSFD